MFRPVVGIYEILLPEYHADATYEVCLGDNPTASDVCDWLGHVAEKTWARPEVLGALVLAIDRIVGLQGLR